MIPPRTLQESGVKLYSHAFPAVFSHALGCEVFDTTGRRWLDFFCGAGALNYGHNHPRLVEAVVEHLSAGRIVHALDVDTPAKFAFLTRLGAILEARSLDYHVQFCGPTGADAIEAALKLARKLTGRSGVVAFSGSFHGMTRGAASVSSSRSVRELGAERASDVTFVPFATGPGGTVDAIDDFAARLRDDMSGASMPGAILVEAFQFEGGMYVAPASWLRRLRDISTEFGIVLILDEIQSGCGRTGRFFAFEHAGIRPDIVTVSKSLSGIGLPLSICLIAPELDAWDPGDHTGTFRANQLAMVSAAAALTLWDEPELARSLAEGNAQLVAFREELCANHESMVVRVCGMALGVEGAGVEWARIAQRAAFERGLLIETCGRGGAVLKVCPPLPASPDLLSEGLEVLTSAIKHACGASCPAHGPAERG
ncbi:MAG TPA: diaminobutyrate--2-oxoglutarate transaminase [Thermoleophilaceae bacterium]|jgi:diaminobutyrate-2-oxoglutarate transaminase